MERTRVVAYFRDRIAIDPRALGVFRILIGAILLVDIFVRSQDLIMFYTDAGVLPRQVLLAEFADPALLSVHLATGIVEGIAAIFLVQALVAVGLLVGYQTRIMSVAAWVLWMSLHNRMPLVLNGGDDLLRMLLFWGMFVPLGLRYSLDARDRPVRRQPISSIGSAFILFQVILMYSVNALLKHSGTRWPSGDAIAYAMSLEQFTTPLGDLLIGFPMLMELMTYSVLIVWSLAPLLILLGGWPRAAVVAVFMSVHIGIGLSMHVGLFSPIAVTALMLFVPPRAWDLLEERVNGTIPAVAEPVMTPVSERIRNGLAPENRIRTVRDTMVAIVAITAMLIVVLWNVQFMSGQTDLPYEDALPDVFERQANAVRLVQYWNMFAPEPLWEDGWYVVPAERYDGSTIDLYRGTPVSYEKPADVSSQYPNQRWRKYLGNLWLRSYAGYRQYYAKYLCQQWNADGQEIRSIEIIYMLEETTDTGDLPPEKVTLLTYHCPR